MTDDHITPEELLKTAKLLAQNILGLPTNQRTAELDKIKELRGGTLHALVISQIREIRASARKHPIAKKGDNMAKDGKNTTLLHFAKDGRKMRTLQVTGMEYNQHLASGDLYFATMSGSKDVINQFMDIFKATNERVNLVIAHPSGRQTLFQAPISIATIRAHTNDTMGTTQLLEVKMRFFKEVVTLNLSDDDEVMLD